VLGAALVAGALVLVAARRTVDPVPPAGGAGAVPPADARR
jgi:hypothetical protein